jgi:hypothetical protein
VDSSPRVGSVRRRSIRHGPPRPRRTPGLTLAPPTPAAARPGWRPPLKTQLHCPLYVDVRSSPEPKRLFERVNGVPQTRFQALSQVSRRWWIAKGVVVGKRKAHEPMLVDTEGLDRRLGRSAEDSRNGCSRPDSLARASRRPTGRGPRVVRPNMLRGDPEHMPTALAGTMIDASRVAQACPMRRQAGWAGQ